MKTTLQILKEARELLSEPKRWTTQAAARDATGNEVSVDSPRAACFCSIGAIERMCLADGEEAYCRAERALRDAAKELFGSQSIVNANDRRPEGHAGVLKMFDRAIEAEEART